MKVISCYDGIEDGIITSVTYKVFEGEACLQELKVEITGGGKEAILVSNKIYNCDEQTIVAAFKLVKELLYKSGVETILIHNKNSDGELIMPL